MEELSNRISLVLQRLLFVLPLEVFCRRGPAGKRAEIEGLIKDLAKAKLVNPHLSPNQSHLIFCPSISYRSHHYPHPFSF